MEEEQGLTGSDSYWDPEDPRSNVTGAQFGKDLNLIETYFITDSYIQKFEEFMKNRGIIDKNDPSISPDKIRIIEGPNSIQLPQRPYDYSGYGGELVAQQARRRNN